MKLTLNRAYFGPEYTIGELSIDGKYFCDTLEETYRDLSKEKKVPGQTAIPFGTYSVTLDVVSPRFKNSGAYAFCRGKLPRLLNVPYFEGILIHIGNYPKDTDGCILVGKNTVKGAVMESTSTFRKLYEVLRTAHEPITIEVK